MDAHEVSRSKQIFVDAHSLSRNTSHRNVAGRIKRIVKSREFGKVGLIQLSAASARESDRKREKIGTIRRNGAASIKSMWVLLDCILELVIPSYEYGQCNKPLFRMQESFLIRICFCSEISAFHI